MANAERWAELTDEDIKDTIEEYLGRSGRDLDMDSITQAVRAILKLKNQEEREAAMSAMGAFFCRECGSDALPCYCMRDD